MSKIVYLIEQPLDNRNLDRFGIQNWIDRGWEVEVWDLTPLSHPRVWQQYLDSGPKLDEFGCYFPIASKQQLEQRYSEQKRTDYFVDFVGDNYSSIRIKVHLVRSGATRITCSTGLIPTPDDVQKHAFLTKLKKAIRVGPLRSLNLFANALVCKLAAPYILPGLTIVSGEKSLASFAASEDRIVRAHNFDYDIYLRANKSVCSSGRFAVFIDQDFCFHPEYTYQGISRGPTPEKYFGSVCSGLRRISDALGIGLRVAAHPRAAYRKGIPDYFEGIEIEYGKTAELVRQCDVVVCHDSTAIQFAVLFEKPVIFFTTEEIESLFFDSSFRGESIARFASELGKSVINVDRNMDGVDWQKELAIDSRKYHEYRSKYIKTEGSPEMPYWDIVIDHIERIGEPSLVNSSERCVHPNGAK